MLTLLLQFSVRHPRTVVALALALTCVALVFIPRIQLRLDGRSLIPEGQPDFAQSDAAASLFGLRDLVVVGVRPGGGSVYNAETLARIGRLSEGLASVEGVVASSVLSLTTAPRLSVEGGRVETRPLLEEGAALDEAVVERLRRETEAQGLDDGVLVAPGGRAAAVVAKVSAGADRERVLEGARRLVEAESGGEDAVYLSGTALAQAILGRSAARDLLRLIPAVVVVICLTLFLAFRHASPALLSLAEICVSLTWAAGLMGLTGRPVFVTTLVLPVVLIAVGVSDDVYALSHYFAAARGTPGAPAAATVLRTFREVMRPISLTAVSTVVGLLSMAASGLEPLRVFGLCGAATILFSTLFTFTLIPALLVLTDPRPAAREGQHGGPLARLVMRTTGALTARRRPWRVLALAFVMAGCSAALLLRLRVDDSWIKNLPAASDIVRGDRFFNESLAGTTCVELMFDSGHDGGFLNPAEFAALGEAERTVARLGDVGATGSFYDDVVRVNASLRGTTYRAFAESLREGGTALSSGEIEQSLLLLSTVRRAPLRERLDEGFRRARLTVFIRNADYGRIDAVLRAARAGGAGESGGDVNHADAGGSRAVVAFGDGWISYLTVRLLVDGQVYSIALALLTDLFLISLLLRSARLGLVAILPVAFSVLLVFGALALAGIPLGIANSMFAGIAIGVGLDFSIHLCAAYYQGRGRGLASHRALERALDTTAPAICTSAVSIAAGFAVLLFSEVSPNAQLGLMICLSLLACALTTLVLVPCLLTIRRVAG